MDRVPPLGVLVLDDEHDPVPRFKECRLKAGLTQQEAAMKLGKTASALQKWEVGENSPTIRDIYGLAKVYRVRPSEFFEHPEHQAIFELSVSDRKRIVIEECCKVLPTVPLAFAEHWVQTLKVVASIVRGRSKY